MSDLHSSSGALDFNPFICIVHGRDRGVENIIQLLGLQWSSCVTTTREGNQNIYAFLKTLPLMDPFNFQHAKYKL